MLRTGRTRILGSRFPVYRVHRERRVLSAPLSTVPTRESQSLSPDKSNDFASFDDTATAFRCKTNGDIIRAMLVFRMTCIPFFVRNSGAMVRASYRFLGDNITNFFLRHSIFQQFCGGDDLDSIIPTVHQLRSSGIRAILDYAAESDTDEGESKENDPEPIQGSFDSRGDGVVSARVHMYESEDQCELHKRIFLKCIKHVSKSSPNAFAAIKITALGRPELLLRVSEILRRTTHLFQTVAVADHGGGVLNRDIGNTYEHMEHTLSPAKLEALFTHVGMADSETAQTLFSQMDTNNDGQVDYIEWLSLLQPGSDSARLLFAGQRDQAANPDVLLPDVLDDAEMNELELIVERVNEIAQAAAEMRVRLMVDAEHTYFQPLIDHLVLGLQRQHNLEFPSIYNTYQCYLKDSYQRVIIDMERAKREGFKFAGKVVRGAYLVQERKRALEMGYESPIHETKQDTDDNYDRVVEVFLQKRHRAALMIASHNEDSIRNAVRRMDELEIPRSGGGVAFGQLLGMCDHVTYSLGAEGYDAFKYVPYGPIQEVVPYLIRRVEENSDIMGGVGKERELLTDEMSRRLNVPPKVVSLLSGVKLTR
jgi:proline dehydrogenase